MGDNNLIYSVEQIFDDYLKMYDKKSYNIPEYQRGYKWTSQSVDKLLNDINNFKQNGINFYCLQNITIVNGENNLFNVVDGQQRLTTLLILLSYLGEKKLINDKLIYSVRENTHNFINEYIITGSIWSDNFKDYEDKEILYWLNEEKNKHFNHQDTYYIFKVAKKIENYFKDKSNDDSKDKSNNDFKNMFKDKLLRHVKLIINKLEKSNEEKIFGNLNSNRVPLDGSDLIRAILITRIAQEEVVKSGFSIKDIVQINECRVRIGIELDEINNWWGKEEVKEYFKNFISIKQDDKTKELFKDDYPINNLYKLYAENEAKELFNLDLFEYGHDKNGKEGDDHIELYKRILKLQNILKDWFYDREIFHYLGFLFITLEGKKINFKQILDIWNQKDITRDSFKIELKKKIRDYTFRPPKKDNETDEDVDGWNYCKSMIFKDPEKDKELSDFDWYSDTENMLDNILVLIDVIELSIKDINEKHSFLNYNYFKKYQEDKEHIFPQTPIEKDAVPEKVEQYISLLEKIKLNDDDNNYKKIKTKFEEWKTVKSEETFTNLQSVINDFLRDKISINSIGNIVLLDSKINRSYGNDFYLDKRQTIIEKIKGGKYIRQHTLNTFIKNIKDDKNKNQQDLNFWSQEDIKKNAENIVALIDAFFKEIVDESK